MEPSRKKQKKDHNPPPRPRRRSARWNRSPTPELDDIRGLPMPSLDPLLQSGSLISSLTDKTLEEMESFFTTKIKSKNVSAAPSTAAGSAAAAAAPATTKKTTVKTATYVPKFGSSSTTNVMQLIHEKFNLNFPDSLKMATEEKSAPVEKKETEEKVEDINADCPLFQLPAELVTHIFEDYMTYDEISQAREASRWFRNTCGEHLNSAFSRLQSKMQARFQAIKSQMPRRESARRKHPLARECDIIETVHMRLTLLQMTFGRHIDRRHCCFFPGAIIDEVYRILEYIKNTENLGRAYKVTDELFDLSTMAMEYFKDKVEPTLPEVNYFTTEFPDLTSTFKSTLTCTPPILRTPKDKALTMKTPKAPLSAPAGKQTSPDKQSQIKRQQRNMQLDLLRVKRDLTRYRGRTVRLEKQNSDLDLRLSHFERKDEEREQKVNSTLEELRKCQTELRSLKQIVQSRVSPPVVEN